MRDQRTVAATSGVGTDEAFGAVVPPLHLSTTFAFGIIGRSRGYDYSRAANPTRDLLSDTIAELEGGAGAVITASGMAAINLVLASFNRDDLVIAPHDCYGGTFRLLASRRARRQLDVAFVDQRDPEALGAALRRRPSLVLIETPSNPLMRVVDIRAVAASARAAGAKVAVDNTFLSPALQRPLTLGADLVIHSTTKFLNGHSDVIGGAVVAASEADAASLAEWANTTGVAGAPFDSYLTLRGLRTLFPRMEYQERTAKAVATFLDRHPLVVAVHYPGLVADPGHSVACRQQAGFGAMLSFELAGDLEAVRRFVSAMTIFSLAESLGGVESLVSHPMTMTHAGMDAESRRAAGLCDGLLRLSIGLEAESDLIADLEAGFAAIGAPMRRCG